MPDSGRAWGGYLLLGFVLWLSATPYMGVDHDARLYVLMALRFLDPRAYAADPWFAWGSQDDWSLYSPVLAAMLTQFGVASGALLVTLLQGGLYVVAVAALCRSWLRGPVALLAFLLLVSLPLFYSPRGMLAVSEGFVTARGLAVPLSLLALSMLRSRPLLAVFLHLLALGMHPIMGLGPALVSLLISLPFRAAIGLLLAGCLSVAALFVAAGLQQVPLIDGDWYHYVEPAVLVFIAPWLRDEAACLLLIFGVLLLGARFGARKVRPLYLSVSVVGVGGFLVTLLANQIPVAVVLQAQVWRTFWLCLVIALVAVADISARYVLRRAAPWRWLGVLLIGAFFLVFYFAGQVYAAGATLLCFMCFSIPSLRRNVDRLGVLLAARRRWVIAFVGVTSLLLFPSFLLSLELAASSVFVTSGWLLPIEGLFRSGGFGLLGLLVFLLLRRLPVALPVVLLLAGGFLAAGYWDVRSSIQRDQEARYSIDGNRNPFSQWIRRGDVVYWHEYPERVWMELGTAGYASTTHCTGLVFSRQRTMQLSDRMLAVAVRGMSRSEYEAAVASGALRERALASARPHGDSRADVLAGYEARANATLFGVQNMCRDSSLKWVIDSLQVDGGYVASWQDILGGVRSHHYLYDCASFRR